MKTIRLANWLYDMAISQDEEHHNDPYLGQHDGAYSDLPDEVEGVARAHHRIAAIIDHLHGELQNSNWKPNPALMHEQVAEEWYFGEHVKRAPLRRIHLGYLEPVLRVPIIERVPADVAYFLMELPGGNDYLDRDADDIFGWHYHYLVDRRTRTDVILCWDTRAVVPLDAIRPLFVEKHGEGRYKAQARPGRWGGPKRESMHRVCAPDLITNPITRFRCASNKSAPVWPMGAILTPRPVSASKAKKVGWKSKQ